MDINKKIDDVLNEKKKDLTSLKISNDKLLKLTKENIKKHKKLIEKLKDA